MVETRHVELRERLDWRDKMSVALTALIAGPLMAVAFVGGTIFAALDSRRRRPRFLTLEEAQAWRREYHGIR